MHSRGMGYIKPPGHDRWPPPETPEWLLPVLVAAFLIIIALALGY